MKVCLLTLGCKVSQYETESIAKQFKELGYEITFNFDFADIYVINTCAVTNEAQKKSRQMVSKARKKNPNAKFLICGCASQNKSEEFISENTVVIGTQNKSKIIELLNQSGCFKTDIETTYENFANPMPAHTRAHIKVQDGCNNFCSYCLIPYVRGRSRSRQLDSIVSEAKELSKTAKEIVIVGINVSDYKINGELALDKLVLALKEIPSRFRFGSLEVNVVTEEFLNALKVAGNFAPHFHLSMQSGSNQVLKDMNRKYTKETYLEKVRLIRSYFPNACITTDVIVGFPTETEELFNETVETVKKAEFYNMHIFTYSPREGTVASKKYKMLNGVVTLKRHQQLSEINKQFNLKYLNNQINKTLEFLLEEETENFYVGRTENYLKVYVPKTQEIEHNKFYPIKILGLINDGLVGEI